MNNFTNVNIVDLVSKVTCAPPQSRRVYKARKDGVLTVAAVTTTVRIVGGLDMTINVYAKSKGNAQSIKDVSVGAVLPQGIDASDDVRGKLLAHIEAHVQGWSGWRDAALASFAALRDFTETTVRASSTLTMAGFDTPPEPPQDAPEPLTLPQDAPAADAPKGKGK